MKQFRFGILGAGGIAHKFCNAIGKVDDACVAAVALGIDQLTKMWAQQALGDGRTVPLIPGLLSLTLVHNPGASLGLGSGSTWLISLLAVVACVVMAVLAARTISMRYILQPRIISTMKTL